MIADEIVTHDSSVQRISSILAGFDNFPPRETTLKWYEDNKVTFVRKDLNPPNCQEICPIELFWALVKAKLKKHVQAVNTAKKFKKDWSKMAISVGRSSVQNLMRSVRGKVRHLGYGK